MEELKLSNFTVKDENNNDVECQVLFSFQSNETKKEYLVYTDNTKDDEGNIRIYASIYIEKDGKPELKAIEDDKEWKIIEEMWETFSEELEDKE